MNIFVLYRDTIRKVYFKIRVISLLTALAILMLITSGCGSPSNLGDSVDQTGPDLMAAPGSDQDTDIALEKAARAEGGELMFYTSTNLQDLEQLLSKFEETYPFVETDYFRASGDSVLQKAFTEAQAGQHFADVFEIQAFEIYRLNEAGLLQPFIAPQSKVYPSEAKDAAGLWNVDRINTVVIGYNSELVDEEDVPTTWEELLDPKWKGLIGVEANDVELLVGMASVWGDEKAFSYWEGIAELEPGIVSGHTELAELVAAGEFAISPTLYGYRVEKMKSKGAPIEWVKTDMIIAYPEILAMAAEAPHPATAKFFINWLLSEEGQLAVQQLGRIPARPGIEANPKVLNEGLNLIYTSPSMAADYNFYAEKWKSFFNLD